MIFLDVDGVLNNRKTTRKTTQTLYPFVGIRHIKNLKRIINSTGARIVLSSDWRCDRDNPECNEDFLELKHELLRWGIHFYGFTPEIESGHRGEEINLWLLAHPEVSNFVILDDREDIEPNTDHWVKTTMDTGLGKKETEDAIKILLEK